MTRSQFKNIAIFSFLAFILLGIIGIYTIEPGVDWERAIKWTIMFIVTPGSDYAPTSPISGWFQSLYGILNFVVLTMALATVIVPPVLDWWSAQNDGRARITKFMIWGKRLVLLIDPVDWEKVESILEELTLQASTALVIVVSDSTTLGTLPPHLLKKGIFYVRGNLRARETYVQAGIVWAEAALICAGSYNDPAADQKSSALAYIIKQVRPEVRIVVEQVSHDNDDLFTGNNTADATVCFDEVTLAAVAQKVALQATNLVQVKANTVDDAQAQELWKQLRAVGREQDPQGQEVRIILPGNLDDTETDYEVLAQLQRAEESTVVALYLSVSSCDIFDDQDNTVCGDEVMARALVQAIQF